VITLLGLSGWAYAGDMPSTALLEFLGGASKLGHQWVDPMTLHEAPGVLNSDSDAGTSAPAGSAVELKPDQSRGQTSQPGSSNQEVDHAE